MNGYFLSLCLYLCLSERIRFVTTVYLTEDFNNTKEVEKYSNLGGIDLGCCCIQTQTTEREREKGRAVVSDGTIGPRGGRTRAVVRVEGDKKAQ